MKHRPTCYCVECRLHRHQSQQLKALGNLRRHAKNAFISYAIQTDSIEVCFQVGLN